MNKKRGFTLIEVLVVIVIMALLGGIGVISYQTIFRTGEEKYYNSVESSLLLAGNDYFMDHREFLPYGNDVGEVSLNDLVSAKYIEPIKDSKGNACTTGKVYAYRENDKLYYEACLNCNGYHSSGKYCGDVASNKITITAKTASDKEYDVNKSYSNVAYANKENVFVTFTMQNSSVKKYEIINTTKGTLLECLASDRACTKEITESGTYKVTAYNDKNETLGESQFFNVKIAKGGPQYTVDGPVSPVQMNKDESKCLSVGAPTKTVTFTIKKNNVNDEYRTIKYQVDGQEEKTNNGLIISVDLPSGSHQIDIIVTDFAGNTTVVTKKLDVSYLVDIEYSDNTTDTHEVVTGKTYNYLRSLPLTKTIDGNSIDIKWQLNDTQFSPETEIVEINCSHTITGNMSIPVQVEDFTKYCKNPQYTGSDQTITNAAPENVTFDHNTGKDVDEYTVIAKIETPKYIWQDVNTFDYEDKPFKCRIIKATNTVTITSQPYTYDGQTKSTSTSATYGTPSVSYYTNSTCTTAASNRKDAGTYYAIATVAESDNYNTGNSGCQEAMVINKAQDSLSVTYKSVNSDGKAGIPADITATSGRTGITVTYYSNSGCTTKTTTSNAVSAGGAPKKKGTYYIKASIATNTNYTAASLDCTKAVTVCVLEQSGLNLGGTCSTNGSFGGCKKEGKNTSFCCNNTSTCQYPGRMYTYSCTYKCS